MRYAIQRAGLLAGLASCIEPLQGPPTPPPTAPGRLNGSVETCVGGTEAVVARVRGIQGSTDVRSEGTRVDFSYVNPQPNTRRWIESGWLTKQGHLTATDATSGLVILSGHVDAASFSLRTFPSTRWSLILQLDDEGAGTISAWQRERPEGRLQWSIDGELVGFTDASEITLPDPIRISDTDGERTPLYKQVLDVGPIPCEARLIELNEER